MNLITLYYLFVHWIADFVLQTGLMATKKSSSNYYLTMHVAVYTTVTIFGWWLLFLILGIHVNILTYLVAYIAIFVMHWITDYITSRVNTELWVAKRVHDFFVMVGFDQWLHYGQIYLVLNYIIFWNFDIFPAIFRF